MRIRIGIVGEPAGWNMLLDQEGVPHARVHGDLMPEHFSAVVVNDAADDREVEMVRQYLRLGGGVLCSAKVYAEIRDTTCGRRYLDFVLPEEGSVFAGAGLVDIRARSPVAWNANELTSDSGGATAFVGTFEGGLITALPFDASSLALDERAARMSFYASTPRLPFERVSAVGKNGVRRLVHTALERLHNARGIPYAHLWYYPDDATSVFMFRIDTDSASASEIESLYEFLREQRVRGTWFVDVQSQQDFIWRFAQMQGQEVGLHCFEHRTFPDEQRNRDNILRAREHFRTARLGAEGFAAPFGRWNRNLGRVLSDFRFEYSSEFSYDYDNLPSVPVLERGRNGVLQVPVHPISIGTLRRQGLQIADLSSYVQRVANEKKVRREPLGFYHHPKDGNEDVLRELFTVCRTDGVRNMTMGEYARWWKSRVAAIPDVTWQDYTMRVDLTATEHPARLRVVNFDGKECIVPLAAKIDLSKVDWRTPRTPPPPPDDIERTRAFNVRIPLTVAVDTLTSLRRR